MAFGLAWMAFGLACMAFGLSWVAFGLAWKAFGLAPTPESAKNREITGILALRAHLRALRARNLKKGKAGTGVLVQDTFTPIFVMLLLYLGTLHLDTVSNGGDPPRAFPSPNPPQKENLLASLGG